MESGPDGDGPKKTGAPADAGLQFDKVELVSPAAAAACGRCRRPVVGEYFEMGGHVVCRACGVELGGGRGGASPWLRAVMYGGGAALLGTIAWYLIIKISNYELGLIAVVVGLFVGRAVRKGSRGRGGWRYQLLAMLLTYGSITASKVPFIIDGIRQGAAQTDQASGSSGQDSSAQQPGAAATATPKGDKSGLETKAPTRARDVVLAFAVLLGFALASPFLMGTENIMGIIIIGIALYEAWKTNRRVPMNGPFRLGAAPAAGPPPVVATTT